ncbi:MAG: spoIIIJ-associated protein [Parcubacteria group bacterium Gr01-1014_66]|nr:MAG: spoIIIJ-associated protein [Parcubacteria group bacterium Gr01-1014_66]
MRRDLMDHEFITQEINKLFAAMGFADVLERVEVHQGEATRFCVHMTNRQEGMREEEGRPSNMVHMLIGEGGNNLAAIEHVLKRVVRRHLGEDCKFTLDLNDYRMERLKGLKQDVKAAAKEVILYKKEVPLHPMSAFERRIVHLLLAEYPDLATESVGREPDRHVVIKPFP